MQKLAKRMSVSSRYLSKLTQNLPNQERLSSLGEIEFIVNFLDNILSSICRCPDKNEFLVWLNQQDENTTVSKSNAIIMAISQKISHVTLGTRWSQGWWFHVKPRVGFCGFSLFGHLWSYSYANPPPNRKVIVIQCIGYAVLFDLLSEHNGTTMIADILKSNTSKIITEIGTLLQKVDRLKIVGKGKK